MNYYILKFKVLENAYTATSMIVNDDELLKKINNQIAIQNNIEITLPKTRGVITDYIDNVHSLIIISETIKSCIQKHCKDKLQYHPVNLQRSSDRLFFILNILNVIDAIDYETSVYSEIIPNTKVLKKIDKLILDQSKIKDSSIFTLQGRTEIIISEKLKIALEKLDLEVMQFINVNDYTYQLGKVVWN